MPCYFPMQAHFELRSDGKKDVSFCKHRVHQSARSDDFLLIPCGQCVGCRLERSREWGLRCVHEAKMHEQNCFVTLTFDDDRLLEMCPDGSLAQEHISLFMKRLRRKLDYSGAETPIRYFACGEYGPKLGRPHYHLCLFNFDFPDRKHWRSRAGFSYYTSEVLSSLWPYGYSVIGDLSFESAAYVARYCVKKITGKDAADHYCGRKPEFSTMSLRPGIGKPWLDKFSSDVYNYDFVLVNGMKVSPPKFYDRKYAESNPTDFENISLGRMKGVDFRGLRSDNIPERLAVKAEIAEARYERLVRSL